MVVIETAREAARRLAKPALAGGFRPVALHTYTDARGQPLYFRIRAKHPQTGEKWLRPMRRNGRGYELGEPEFPDGKPLYRLDDLARNASAVWFVEGENCADALVKLGLLATTAGSVTSDERADFRPLAGRKVTLWPDNDRPGIEHMQRVAAKLAALGCSVETIAVSRLGLAEHGDCVDWLSAHARATRAHLPTLPRLQAAPSGVTDTSGLELIRGADVELQPVTWLWRDWLAAGALHVLAGAPGAGKSTLALAMAATITSGGRWPDGSCAEPGDVVIWSGEDNISTTLKPRLVAMGADVSRVHFVGRAFDEHGSREFDPAEDMQRLREALSRLATQGRKVHLVVLDPIVSAVAGDSNKAAEVRRSLQPIRDMAETLACAVLGISHYSKGTAGRDPVERVTGSIAFGAVPRLVFGAAKMPQEDGGGRILVKAKNNLGLDTGGFHYDIKLVEAAPGIVAVRVLWGKAVEGTARELLARAEAPADEERTMTADAEDLLRDLLLTGPATAREIKRQAADASISEKALRRARERLGVQVRRQGFGRGASYVWVFPDDPSVMPSAPCVPMRAPEQVGQTWGTNGDEGTHADRPRCPRCDGEGCPQCDAENARELAEERAAIIAEGARSNPATPADEPPDEPREAL
jgi:energy-coupling factor transporter ATP-binding protein EcfA2